MTESQNRLPKNRQRVPRQLAPYSHEETESIALAEAEQQDLERSRSKHYRDQKSRRILAWGTWILMVVVFIVVVGAVFTLGYHLLFPNTWYWLDPDELQDIKNFVLSGAVVGLGTTYIRRYLEER